MSAPSHLAAIAALARLVLEADDLDRMVMPAMADAVTESPGRSTVAGIVSLGSQVAKIVVLATGYRLVSAARSSSWWPVFAATVAGVCGAVGLRCTERGSLSHAQQIFVLLGLTASIVVVVTPSRIARMLSVASVAIAAAAIATVPWVGFSYEGVNRWLRFGPVAVHASVLVLPVFAVLVARVADRWARPAVAGLVLGVIALLLAQPDSPAAVVCAITAVAACWRSRARAWALAASAIGAIAALLLHSPLPQVSHVEGAHRLLANQGLPWLAAGAGALGCMLLLSARSWSSLARSTRSSARLYERQAAAATAALAALMIVPRAMGDGGLPLIAYGGSAVFTAYVLTAVVIRSSRQGAGDHGVRAA